MNGNRASLKMWTHCMGNGRAICAACHNEFTEECWALTVQVDGQDRGEICSTCAQVGPHILADDLEQNMGVFKEVILHAVEAALDGWMRDADFVSALRHYSDWPEAKEIEAFIGETQRSLTPPALP